MPLQARKMLVNLQEASSHALDAGRVRSVLACGFYPLFGRLLPPGAGPSQRNRSTLLTGKGEKVRHTDHRQGAAGLSKVGRSILGRPSYRERRETCTPACSGGEQSCTPYAQLSAFPQIWQIRP